MNLLKSWKYLSLLVDSASTRMVSVKNEFGDVVRKPVSRAAINEMKRPPFIPSAPSEKRVWSQQEIEEFYQTNPAFRV